MALGHLVLQSEPYADFFREMKARGDYVLVDNGSFEGRPLKTSELLEAAERIGADEIVLPDVPGFMMSTMIAIQNALIDIPVGCPFRKMAVPQGETQRMWIECYKAIYETTSIEVIGIGANAESLFADKGGRMAIVYALNTLSMQREETEYHLLGCREDPRALQLYSKLPWIRSMDSQVPVLAGSQGVRFPIEGESQWQRPSGCIDYLSTETFGKNDNVVDFNVGQFIRWSGGSNGEATRC